ncbi:MAG: chorismate-binding protein [Deltaproteobacteria bacterium]|nr:chorismate-binding protein [Deltaproteobacteria bacterium]
MTEYCLVLVDLNKNSYFMQPSAIYETKSEEFDIYDFFPEQVDGIDYYKSYFKEAKRLLESGSLKKIVLTVSEKGTCKKKGKLMNADSLSSRGGDALYYKVETEDFIFSGFSPDPFITRNKHGKIRLHIVASTSSDPTRLSSHELDKSLSDYYDLISDLDDIDMRSIKAGNLYHLRSTATIKTNYGLETLLSYAYPPSTIFGSPYEVAFAFKKKYNPVFPLWGNLLGFNGLLSDGLSFRSILAIRGVFLYGSQYRIIAGSGILESSICDNEYQECLKKIESVKEMFS